MCMRVHERERERERERKIVIKILKLKCSESVEYSALRKKNAEQYYNISTMK